MAQQEAVPAEVLLQEVKRLLEGMGFRGVTPYVATGRRLMQICQRVDAARWSRARDVAAAMQNFGAAPYVAFVLDTGVRRVCIPDVYIDAPGVYYVHEVDCRGKTLTCADLARLVLDMLSLPAPAELLLSIHPDQEELCQYNILPPAACRRGRRRNNDGEDAAQQPQTSADDLLMKQLEEELSRRQPAGASATTQPQSAAATQPAAPPQVPTQPRDEAVETVARAVAAWPRRDRELLAKLLQDARSFDELLAAYLAEEYGCTPDQMAALVSRVLKQVNCEDLEKLRQL